MEGLRACDKNDHLIAATSTDDDDVVVALTIRGKDDPVLYACPKCGAVYSPSTFMAKSSDAHAAARRMAKECCEPQHCDMCGCEVEKWWTRCPKCRLRTTLRKAVVVNYDEWDGESPLYHEGTQRFYDSAEDFYDLHETYPIWFYKTAFRPVHVDFDVILERISEDHPMDDADILESVGGLAFENLERAVREFNEDMEGVGSWEISTSMVVVLDHCAFNRILEEE
jgi:hypothetical protein